MTSSTSWVQCLRFERALDRGDYDAAALMLRLGDGNDWPDLVPSEVEPLNRALARYGLEVRGYVDDVNIMTSWRVVATAVIPAEEVPNDDSAA